MFIQIIQIAFWKWIIMMSLIMGWFWYKVNEYIIFIADHILQQVPNKKRLRKYSCQRKRYKCLQKYALKLRRHKHIKWRRNVGYGILFLTPSYECCTSKCKKGRTRHVNDNNVRCFRKKIPATSIYGHTFNNIKIRSEGLTSNRSDGNAKSRSESERIGIKNRRGEIKSIPMKPQRLKSVAGHPKNRLYIDSGASVHIIFNREFIDDLRTLTQPLEISAGGKSIQMKHVGKLCKGLQHLPLPIDEYYYDEFAIANLLSFSKIADEFHIICNTGVDDAIYIKNKNNNEYLRFERDKRNGLYYFNYELNLAQDDQQCHFNTIEKTKMQFSTQDQKRAEKVRILQERCGYPSDEDFINALECNIIQGVDFVRRDVKIANEIYGYSKNAAMGKMRNTRKGQKMVRVIDELATPVPHDILEHYGNVHIDIDIMFVNNIPFFTVLSMDLKFIHCRAMLSRHHQRVQDTLRIIVKDYQSRGFNVISASGDIEFEPLKEWMKEELNVVLNTCDRDGHVPRIERAIQFIKERVRCIQSGMPFRYLPRRLTIEMVRRAVIFINSFPRRGGIHNVMSPRQILYGKRFIIPLCKFGEYVLAYNAESGNKTNIPRVFSALYIAPNDNGTGHKVFKLQTKKVVSTRKCTAQPMPDDVINIINHLGKEEGVREGIQFLNIDGKATLMDLYPTDEEDDNESNTSDIDYQLSEVLLSLSSSSSYQRNIPMISWWSCSSSGESLQSSGFGWIVEYCIRDPYLGME